jgi:hypothetical protein
MGHGKIVADRDVVTVSTATIADTHRVRSAAPLAPLSATSSDAPEPERTP